MPYKNCLTPMQSNRLVLESKSAEQAEFRGDYAIRPQPSGSKHVPTLFGEVGLPESRREPKHSCSDEVKIGITTITMPDRYKHCSRRKNTNRSNAKQIKSPLYRSGRIAVPPVSSPEGPDFSGGGKSARASTVDVRPLQCSQTSCLIQMFSKRCLRSTPLR